MAYLGSQRVGDITQHEEIIAKIENIGASNDSLLFTIDTTNITGIDLLEFRFRPDPGEVALDLDILDLKWRNTNLKNNAGLYTVPVYPVRQADGTYHYEPNHPPNLYYEEHSLHTHLPGRYSLVITKRSSGLKLQTINVYLRFKVTKFISTKLDYVKKFESVILNQ